MASARAVPAPTPLPCQATCTARRARQHQATGCRARPSLIRSGASAWSHGADDQRSRRPTTASSKIDIALRRIRLLVRRARSGSEFVELLARRNRSIDRVMAREFVDPHLPARRKSSSRGELVRAACNEPPQLRQVARRPVEQPRGTARACLRSSRKTRSVGQRLPARAPSALFATTKSVMIERRSAAAPLHDQCALIAAADDRSDRRFLAAAGRSGRHV